MTLGRRSEGWMTDHESHSVGDVLALTDGFVEMGGWIMIGSLIINIIMSRILGSAKYFK